MLMLLAVLVVMAMMVSGPVAVIKLIAEFTCLCCYRGRGCIGF